MPKLQTEKIRIPTPGRWNWNDETQSLEFIRFNKVVEVNEKRINTKPVNFQDLASKRPEGSKELNDFLAALLLYLSCYFERKSLEKNPIPLMAEQSTSEMQVMTEALVKVELAQKQLALCYSSLVLGPGRFQQHHMARGRSHVSSTYKDRQLYECMYSFFCYVAWVTFSRNDLRGIQEEVGRLLRSDTFNPALRTRVDATEDTLLAQDTYSKEGQTDSKEHSQSHNATEQRKSQRRPALCKIMTQRSPLMVSLLPLPSEDAPHLFGRGRPRKQSQETLSDLESLMGELKDQLATFSFGILGKPFSQFSCTALMPKNEDEHDDDKEDADIHVRSDKTTYMAQRPVASSPDQRGSLNRADTNTSRATAGAVS